MLRAALAVAVLASLGAWGARGGRHLTIPAAPRASVSALAPMPCPPRHVPEGSECVPLPDVEGEDDDARGTSDTRDGAALARQPDRAEAWSRYVGPLGRAIAILSSGSGRAGPVASSVALELAARRGEPVVVLELDHQRGPTRVVDVGRAVGTTVITAHDVDYGDRPRTVLLVHGRLDAIADGVARGAERAPGTPLGFAGDSGDPGLVRVHLEARLVRDDVPVAELTLATSLDAARSIPIDLRNVLRPSP
jgi:hypothetical protein